MSALVKVMNSNAWDTRFSLPTVPFHSNPWIYIAYFLNVAGIADGEDYAKKLSPEVDEFYKKCLKVSGVFTKWPEGGFTSHDELMGAAWLRQGIAREIVQYLSEHDGIYDSECPEAPRETHNVYRFIWLMPFLKACAGYKVSFLSQIIWSISAIANSWKFSGDTSGVLLFWLMCSKMKDYPLSKIAVWFWGHRMKNKHGITPKIIFSKYYLTETPVLAEIAPESW